MRASLGGKSRSVELLLNAGAETEVRDTAEQQTALIKSAIVGNRGCISALLRHHADASARDIYSLTATDWARRKEHREIVRILKAHPKRFAK